MCRAALLSQYSLAGSVNNSLIPESKLCMQMISYEVVAVALYSASAEDLETMLSFFFFCSLEH